MRYSVAAQKRPESARSRGWNVGFFVSRSGNARIAVIPGFDTSHSNAGTLPLRDRTSRVAFARPARSTPLCGIARTGASEKKRLPGEDAIIFALVLWYERRSLANLQENRIIIVCARKPQYLMDKPKIPVLKQPVHACNQSASGTNLRFDIAEEALMPAEMPPRRGQMVYPSSRPAFLFGFPVEVQRKLISRTAPH